MITTLPIPYILRLCTEKKTIIPKKKQNESKKRPKHQTGPLQLVLWKQKKKLRKVSSSCNYGGRLSDLFALSCPGKVAERMGKDDIRTAHKSTLAVSQVCQTGEIGN